MSALGKRKPLPEGYICKACGEGGHSIHECPSKVPKKPKTTTQPVKKIKLFISGLTPDTTNDSLSSWLNANNCEFKKDVDIAIDKEDATKCRGFGFITLAETYLESMLALNGQEHNGKTIKIQLDNKPANANKPKTDMKRCYRCGQMHDPKGCTNPRICYKCKGNDHLSSACPKKKI